MSAAVRLHVERTDDPAVLRWVVHDAAVVAAGDGPRSVGDGGALADLVLAGAPLDVSVHRGHVLVRAADPATWAELAPQVHRAIASDIADRAGWLTRRELPATPVAISARRAG